MSTSNHCIRIEHSQNHLRSRRLVGRLLEKSSVGPGDLVYDIGAGLGIISQEVARRGARVVAIEKDAGLYSRLKRRLGASRLIDTRHEDFLKHRLPLRGEYKVFASIPFSATADIVRKLLCRENPPRTAISLCRRRPPRGLAVCPPRASSLFSSSRGLSSASCIGSDEPISSLLQEVMWC